MRLIKMFGLAATAVAAIMAIIAVSPASASLDPLDAVVLCKTQTVGSLCEEGDHFPSNTSFHAELVEGTHSTIAVGGSGDVLCQESTLLGHTTSSLTLGLIATVAFGRCEIEGIECSYNALGAPYLVKGQLTINHEGYEVLITGINGLRPRVAVLCLGVIDCTYGANALLLTVEEDANDSVLRIEQELEGEGIICGLSGPTLRAEYLTRCLGASNQYQGCYLRMESF